MKRSIIFFSLIILCSYNPSFTGSNIAYRFAERLKNAGKEKETIKLKNALEEAQKNPQTTTKNDRLEAIKNLKKICPKSAQKFLEKENKI